jgi:hypothetical protein
LPDHRFEHGHDSDVCAGRRAIRIGPWLAVVDNSGCGGAGVSFTGLYRRTK